MIRWDTDTGSGDSVVDRLDRQGRVLDLIGQVYDAALDPQIWPSLAPEIARAVDSTSAVVATLTPSSGGVRFFTQTGNYDAGVLEAYAAYYHQHDLWAERGARLGLGRVMASKDIVADAELERTEFCQDWLRRLDVFYVVGSVFPVAGGDVGILGIHRPRAAGTYDEQDKSLVARFLPHLQRAFQLRSRLSDPAIERQAALDALERTRTATLVVARDGRIIYANGQAESLLREADALRAIAGRLATPRRSASERLTLLINGAIDTAAERGGSAGGALSIPRADRLPLTLLVAPFRPARDGFGAPAPAAILFIRDPEQPTPGSLALQRLFGLTATEASIASALADGKSLDDIAAAHRISLNTARTHLKRILAKTGTNRQAQLVALVLRSVAAMAEK